MQKLMERKRASRLAWLWLAGVVLGAGLYFRFVNLDKKVYWHDEALTSIWIAGYNAAEIRSQLLADGPVFAGDLLRYQRLSPEKDMTSAISLMVLESPEHPPLYYVLARLWAQAFGDSGRAIRSLSAVISLLIFPCLYWLCRELFESSLTAWMAIALMAVSPFHVLYAQEARQYSLLTVAILLSSAALLRAMRRQTKWTWIIYAASIALGLYTHLLFAMVMVAHGIYVLGVELRSINAGRIKISQTVIGYLLSTLLGCAAFAPWFIKAQEHLPAEDAASWFSEPLSVSLLLKRWVFDFGSVFLDSTAGPILRPMYGINHPRDLALVPIFILEAYAIYFLYRSTERRTWLFVVALASSTFLLLALPDLFWGGTRSGIPRYLIASYLGVQLAVAHLFARQITAASLARRRTWRALLGALLVVGIVSCAISSRANEWWSKGVGAHNPRAASLINASRDPLVISDFSGYGFGNTFSLSRLLDAKVRLQLMADADAPFKVVPASDIFIFGASESTRQRIERDGLYRVEPVYEPVLWRLVRK